MYVYDTLSEAVNGLKSRGYTMDFNLHENCLVCHSDRLSVADFHISEVYRFEGNTDPSDEAIVYGIESNSGIRGVLVNGYGISAEIMGDEMARKLNYGSNHGIS